MLNKLTQQHVEVLDLLRRIFQEEGPDGAAWSTQDISDETHIPVADLWDRDMETGIMADLLQHGLVDKWDESTSEACEWMACGCEIEFRWN